MHNSRWLPLLSGLLEQWEELESKFKPRVILHCQLLVDPFWSGCILFGREVSCGKEEIVDLREAGRKGSGDRSDIRHEFHVTRYEFVGRLRGLRKGGNDFLRSLLIPPYDDDVDVSIGVASKSFGGGLRGERVSDLSSDKR